METAMNVVDFGRVLATLLTIGLLASMAGPYAQETVYKWVDEEGVVHFSEQPPDESLGAKVETVTTDRAPRSVAPPPPAVKAAPARETRSASHSAQPQIQTQPSTQELDITQMSLADLDRRCEEARERKIAPLRAAEIANCIDTETGDQEWCENFWADYGDPVRTASGTLTPRKFHDLPECIEALTERNRRVSR
jgi:hypothetical protein